MDADDAQVFERLMRERHSCRAFTPELVHRDTIMRILSTSQRSISDCNIQPWRVMIVGGAALDRLRDALYRRASMAAEPVWDVPPIHRYDGVYLERRRACGWSLYRAVGIERGDRVKSRQQSLENFRLFGAPHLAVITTHASLGPRALLDCGGYVTAFILAAQAHGVASVAQASIAYRADVLREELEIPPDEHVVCGISFGFADATHPANSFRTSRAPISDVVAFRGN